MGSLRTVARKLISLIVYYVRLVLDLVLVDADPQAPYARVLAESDPAVLDRVPPTERLLALLSSRSLFTATPLPPGRKKLVLDLDETLIHSTTRGMLDYDTTIEVALGNMSCIFYIHKRPYADYFLRQVSRWYDLVIFTASTCEYASPVIDWLDPQRLIGQRFYREVRRSAWCLTGRPNTFPSLAALVMYTTRWQLPQGLDHCGARPFACIHH